MDVSKCAIRTRGAAHGPSPDFFSWEAPVEAQGKHRCRRKHATRLHSYRRPSHVGTSTCETRCGSGGASVLRAPPQPFVVSSSRLLLRISFPLHWLRGAAVRTSSREGGTPQRRVEVAESPGPPRKAVLIQARCRTTHLGPVAVIYGAPRRLVHDLVGVEGDKTRCPLSSGRSAHPWRSQQVAKDHTSML